MLNEVMQAQEGTAGSNLNSNFYKNRMSNDMVASTSSNYLAMGLVEPDNVQPSEVVEEDIDLYMNWDGVDLEEVKFTL